MVQHHCRVWGICFHQTLINLVSDLCPAWWDNSLRFSSHTTEWPFTAWWWLTVQTNSCPPGWAQTTVTAMWSSGAGENKSYTGRYFYISGWERILILRYLVYMREDDPGDFKGEKNIFSGIAKTWTRKVMWLCLIAWKQNAPTATLKLLKLSKNWRYLQFCSS